MISLFSLVEAAVPFWYKSPIVTIFKGAKRAMPLLGKPLQNPGDEQEGIPRIHLLIS